MGAVVFAHFSADERKFLGLQALVRLFLYLRSDGYCVDITGNARHKR